MSLNHQVSPVRELPIRELSEPSLDPMRFQPHQTPAAVTSTTPAESGFSLIEMIVGLAIFAQVLVAAFVLFDVNSRVSRVQTEVAELQQSQRIANYDLLRTTRMAGRGGLNPDVAVSVQNNVNNVQIGANNVLNGTDILTVRGVFTESVYVINGDTGYSYTPATGLGSVSVDSVNNGLPQDVAGLQETIIDPSGGGGVRPLALVLVDQEDPSIYAVVEITDAAFVAADVNGDGNVDPGEQRATLQFSSVDPGTYNAQYLAMSQGGAFPPGLRTPTWVGVIEEYRYYIREDEDLATGVSPKLSRAQFYPNTNVAFLDDANNLAVDIADNVLDLQIALALDVDNDGTALEGVDYANRGTDEWLFNHTSDNDTDSWWGLGDADVAWTGIDLFSLRVTTLVRTDRPDPGYRSERLELIEDHDFSESAVPADGDQIFERSFRRRQMQTTVDLRNIG